MLPTTSTMSIINSPKLPPPPPYFSQAILAHEAGQTLYLSGQCGTLNGAFIEGTVQDRTTQIMKNITAVLEEAGMGLGDSESSLPFGPRAEASSMRPRTSLTIMKPSRHRDHLPFKVRRGLRGNEPGVRRRIRRDRQGPPCSCMRWSSLPFSFLPFSVLADPATRVGGRASQGNRRRDPMCALLPFLRVQ